MARFLDVEDICSGGRHFEREVIILCVRWYLRFKLSFRDLVEMVEERGLSIAHTSMAHTTIMRCSIMPRSSSAAGTASRSRFCCKPCGACG